MASMLMLILFVLMKLDISTSMCWRKQEGLMCQGPVPQFLQGTKFIQVTITACNFDVLPNSTFVNVVELKSIMINCNRPIRFESGWTLPLSASGLFNFDLRRNYFSELPNGTFCSKDLESVQLDNNLIKQPEILGFSDGDGLCKVSPVLRELSLNDNQISSLPDGVFSQLHQLNRIQLAFNFIDYIHPMAFRNLTSLKFLHLSNNWLSYIGDTVFLANSQLKRLYLDFNTLNDSIYGAIRPLVNLEALTMNDNLIETIDKETMLQFPKLIYMTLRNNLVSSIPPYCFSNMTKLYSLDLGSNNLNNMTLESSHFAGLNGIFELGLSNASIETIANDAFNNLTTMRVLLLGNNNIQTMPNVSGLIVLSRLNVSYNKIKQIPDKTLAFELDISYNKLKRISKMTMGTVQYILLLNMSNNQIENIEPGTFNVSISTARFDHNKLTSISGVFTQQSRLLLMNLSTNYLTSFSFSDFPPTLKELYLDNNRIETIDAKNFPPQKNLRIINLSNNRLTSLKPIQVPPTFMILHLDNNNISTIDAMTFANANNWRYLSLRNNSLQKLCHTLLPLVQDNYIYRPTLFISGNPFRCTCEFSWVYGASSNDNNQSYPSIPDLEQTKCTGETPLDQSMTLSTVRDNLFKDRFWCKTGVTADSDINSCQCFDTNTFGCTMKCPQNCTCYRKGGWSEVVTQCKNSRMTGIPKEAPELTTTMVIEGNFIKMLKANEFSNYRKLQNLHAQRTNLSYIEDFAFNHLSQLKVLHLDFNQLQTLSNSTFAGLISLQKLFLNDNQLQTIDEDAFRSLETLVILYLRNNQLVRFSVWQLDVNIKLVSMMVDNNPWSCDCEFVEKFRKWLLGSSNSSLVVSVNNVTCQMSTVMSLIPMVSINNTVCLKMDNKTTFSVTVTIVSSIFGILVPSMVIAFLIFYYRKEIQVLVYARYGIRMFRRGPQKDSNLNSDDKPYDVFISYSSLDDDFLFEHILPGLETEVAIPYRLCIHQRDFAAGAYITDAILEAVARSKATLLLLSNNFMESEWCRFEFKAAHLQMLKDPQSKVVVVLLQPKLPKTIDPEIKLYLKTNTYLCWGEKLFWKRLYFALPKPGNT